MQQQLQTLGRRLAPSWAAARARRYEKERRQAERLPELAGRVVDRIGDRVIDGPCAGLRYPTHRLAEVDVPVAKLVGTYERHLHRPLAEAIDSGRRPFIDVGCAEGYYAVGLALRRRDMPVHAYDLARSARSFCSGLASLNDCAGQVQIHRRCNTRQLRQLSLDNAVVLADIEGAEFDLFSDETVALLRGAAVIIEMHRPMEDPASVALLERFQASHSVEKLLGEAVDPDAVPALSFLAYDERVAAVSEWRPRWGQAWLAFTPH